MLDRLNRLLVLNWRQESTARSQLKQAIEDSGKVKAGFKHPLQL